MSHARRKAYPGVSICVGSSSLSSTELSFTHTAGARLPGLPRVGKFTLAASNTLADVPALPGKRALFWPLLQNRCCEAALLLSDVIACSRATEIGHRIRGTAVQREGQLDL